MNKYWRIGTGFTNYVKRFHKLVTINELQVGNTFTIFQIESKFLLLSNDSTLETYGSKSTANQYMNAWISLGFIVNSHGNEYVIATNLKSINELKKLTKINLMSIPSSSRILDLRKTIIVNILVANNVINTVDLRAKNVTKGGELVTTSYIKEEVISEYEKSFASDNRFLREIKEYYDKQF